MYPLLFVTVINRSYQKQLIEEKVYFHLWFQRKNPLSRGHITDDSRRLEQESVRAPLQLCQENRVETGNGDRLLAPNAFFYPHTFSSEACNLPKQCHQLATNHLNNWVDEGHSPLKPSYLISIIQPLPPNGSYLLHANTSENHRFLVMVLGLSIQIGLEVFTQLTILNHKWPHNHTESSDPVRKDWLYHPSSCSVCVCVFTDCFVSLSFLPKVIFFSVIIIILPSLEFGKMKTQNIYICNAILGMVVCMSDNLEIICRYHATNIILIIVPANWKQ